MIRHPLATLATMFLVACVELPAQSSCHTNHLTIFDANIAEFFEVRTIDLQSGPNLVEWRSLMPQTYIRTIRVTTSDRTTVTRQDVTYDGAEVRGQKSPVLHLVLQNAGQAGPRKVQIDYLAPGLSWKADYSLAMGPSAASGTPTEMQLDGWATIQNDTGADICAATVDLVAGEVQLLLPGATGVRTYTANSQIAGMSPGVGFAPEPLTEVKGISVFSRFRLGRNIALTANAQVDRFLLFQSRKLPLEQRNVFENEANAQTLGRGGFMLAPRGLEVRLVSRNESDSPLPAGLITIYTQDDEVPQVVGQDQIPLTRVSADFSVTQGRSNLLEGTRRILDRKTVPDPSAVNRSKVVTQVEVVITNHGANAATALVREGVDGNAREWNVTESSHPHQKLGDRMMEIKLTVPGNGSVTLDYTVESR